MVKFVHVRIDAIFLHIHEAMKIEISGIKSEGELAHWSMSRL